VTRRRQSSDHGSYAVLPTIDRLQLGGSPYRGVDPGGYGGPDPLKYARMVRVCHIHSIKDEQMDTITSLILLILTMLPSSCLISPKETVPFIQSMPLLLYRASSYRGSRHQLQNVSTGDPPSTILIDGVPVEGVEDFIYRSRVLMATANWKFYARLDLPVVQ